MAEEDSEEHPGLHVLNQESLRLEDHYDLGPSSLHVVWSRALAGLRFQEPDVKFGMSPLQPFGPAFAEASSFAQGIV